MKPLKFFIILCLIAAFPVNKMNAQPVYDQYTLHIEDYMTCIDEIVVGDLIVEVKLLPNLWKERVIGGSLIGQTTGSTYEWEQKWHTNYWDGHIATVTDESTVKILKDGKSIGTFHWTWHITIHENGEIATLVEKVFTNCK